jgi:hypothetical protein
MRTARALILVLAGILVAAAVAALRSGAVPLGVRGEWEWLRVPVPPQFVDLLLSGLGCVGFALFAGLGQRALGREPSRTRECLWVAALAVASAAVQVAAQNGAPVGYGLEKWVIALSQKGSNGYYTVAKTEVRDLRHFLAEYPDWIKTQDALHIGTHPPGLIVSQFLLLRAMEGAPTTAATVVENAPEPVTQAFRYFVTGAPMPIADRATLVLTGALTLLACGLTVLPLYALARSYSPAPFAWSAAALWPLVPSAILFQPTADNAFPILSTAAFAMAAWASRLPGKPGLFMAKMAGVSLGVGMQFTLAFLAVGFVVALIIVSHPEGAWRSKLVRIGATGVGFLAVTGSVWLATRANPLAIWWVNQQNHARFYEEYPRSYRAWLIENPIELAIGLGLPAVVWGILGLLRPREAPRVAVAILVTLLLLTLTGKNLSEVARLWLPFMPGMLVTAGVGLRWLGATPWTLIATLILTAAQTLSLQATLQVVYPV